MTTFDTGWWTFASENQYVWLDVTKTWDTGAIDTFLISDRPSHDLVKTPWLDFNTGIREGAICGPVAAFSSEYGKATTNVFAYKPGGSTYLKWRCIRHWNFA